MKTDTISVSNNNNSINKKFNKIVQIYQKNNNNVVKIKIVSNLSKNNNKDNNNNNNNNLSNNNKRVYIHLQNKTHPNYFVLNKEISNTMINLKLNKKYKMKLMIWLNMGLMLISKKYNKDNFSQTKMDRKTIKE
jgi:hypothetical protein